MPSLFANCSGFSEVQIFFLAGLRSGASAMACLATFTILIVLLIVALMRAIRSNELEGLTCKRVCSKNTLKKTWIYFLLLGSTVRLAVLSIGAVGIFDDDASCDWLGFFDQLLSGLHLTLLLVNTHPIIGSIINAICVREGHDKTMCQCKTCKWNKWIKRGIGFTFGAFLVILMLSSTVPFITHTYGIIGGWCWIVNFDNNCNAYTDGFYEQIFLWYLFTGLVCFASILMVVIVLIIVCKKCHEAKKRSQLKEDLEYIFLTYVYQLIIIFPLPLDILVFAIRAASHGYHYPLWVMYSITPAINGFLVPVAFLLYYLKKGSKEKRRDPDLNSRPREERVPQNYGVVSVPHFSESASDFHTAANDLQLDYITKNSEGQNEQQALLKSVSEA